MDLTLNSSTSRLSWLQNKEAEAKEELKRRARQLELQRREQQKRAAATGGGGSSYLGGGISGYSPIPQRFDAPEVPAARTASPAPASSTRAPQFKSSGMKLGSKKTRQAELLDALGDELVSEELSAPPTPSIHEPSPIPAQTRGSLPSVTAER